MQVKYADKKYNWLVSEISRMLHCWPHYPDAKLVLNTILLDLIGASGQDEVVFISAVSPKKISWPAGALKSL